MQIWGENWEAWSVVTKNPDVEPKLGETQIWNENWEAWQVV